MNKELQDIAWSVLPKEFKEEVKKYYKTLHEQYIDYAGLHLENAKAKVQERIVTLEYFFGIHNLTSDAEGEEMLYVNRKKIQEVYRQNKEEINRENVSSSDRDCYETVNEVLKTLFGSKCLPDELNEDNFAKSVGNEVNFATKEPKPAEPKFGIGSIVRFKYCCTPHRISGARVTDGRQIEYHVGKVWAKPTDLEPYTEPTETFTDDCQSQCKSQDQFPDSAKMVIQPKSDGPEFIMLPRLKIAAMAMQGILAHGELVDPDEVTDMAIIYADELIEKTEKGGKDA